MFIAKIQKSIVPAGRILIYNESKSIQHETELTPDIEKFMGNNLKVYAKCSLSPKGIIEIGNLVKNQGW